VRRFFDGNQPLADAIFDEKIGVPNDCTIVDPFDMTHQRTIPLAAQYVDLMKPILRAGQLVYAIPPLSESRQKTLESISYFHTGIRRFLNPHIYPVGLEKQLFDLKTRLILKARGIHNI
jgi:nicotinate phosphoribosyltransferase